MPEPPDFFRDYGVIPHGVSPPPQIVRCFLPWGHVVGQYLGTALMSGLGLGMGVLFALTLPPPVNVLGSGAALAATGYLIYMVTRNDYSWVELDGETLRAKHLYTRRVVERPIEEVEDLLTLVSQVRTVETMIAEAWLGRVRGVEVRFRDKRTPIRVCRADPAMRNAKELIEAICFRMAEKGEVDAEMIDLEGKPLIRRIHWKGPALRGTSVGRRE
jgi:hypothetical protein